MPPPMIPRDPRVSTNRSSVFNNFKEVLDDKEAELASERSQAQGPAIGKKNQDIDWDVDVNEISKEVTSSSYPDDFMSFGSTEVDAPHRTQLMSKFSFLAAPLVKSAKNVHEGLREKGLRSAKSLRNLRRPDATEMIPESPSPRHTLREDKKQRKKDQRSPDDKSLPPLPMSPRQALTASHDTQFSRSQSSRTSYVPNTSAEKHDSLPDSVTRRMERQVQSMNKIFNSQSEQGYSRPTSDLDSGIEQSPDISDNGSRSGRVDSWRSTVFPAEGAFDSRLSPPQLGPQDSNGRQQTRSTNEKSFGTLREATLPVDRRLAPESGRQGQSYADDQSMIKYKCAATYGETKYGKELVTDTDNRLLQPRQHLPLNRWSDSFYGTPDAAKSSTNVSEFETSRSKPDPLQIKKFAPQKETFTKAVKQNEDNEKSPKFITFSQSNKTPPPLPTKSPFRLLNKKKSSAEVGVQGFAALAQPSPTHTETRLDSSKGVQDSRPDEGFGLGIDVGPNTNADAMVRPPSRMRSEVSGGVWDSIVDRVTTLPPGGDSPQVSSTDRSPSATGGSAEQIAKAKLDEAQESLHEHLTRSPDISGKIGTELARPAYDLSSPLSVCKEPALAVNAVAVGRGRPQEGLTRAFGRAVGVNKHLLRTPNLSSTGERDPGLGHLTDRLDALFRHQRSRSDADSDWFPSSNEDGSLLEPYGTSPEPRTARHITPGATREHDTKERSGYKGKGKIRDDMTIETSENTPSTGQAKTPMQSEHRIGASSKKLLQYSTSQPASCDDTDLKALAYDPNSGQVGYESEDRPGEIGDVKAVHPAFRSAKASDPSADPLMDDIDLAISQWSNSPSTTRSRASSRRLNSSSLSVENSPLNRLISGLNKISEAPDPTTAFQDSPNFGRSFSSPLKRPAALSISTQSRSSQQSDVQRLDDAIHLDSTRNTGAYASVKTRNVSAVVSTPKMAHRTPLRAHIENPDSSPTKVPSTVDKGKGIEKTSTDHELLRRASSGRIEQVNELRLRHGLAPLMLQPTDAIRNRHPAHAYVWNTTKLYCRLSHEGQCSICGASCCLYGQQKFKLDNELTDMNPGGRGAAQEKIKDLEYFGGQGIEIFDTFLKCSECRNKICPPCAGRCPKKMCGDIVCKICVPSPSQGCSAHSPPGSSDGPKKDVAAKTSKVSELRKRYAS